MTKNYIPLAQWNEIHSFPSTRTLYRWLHSKRPQWFQGVVHKIGTRWFIDEKAFFEACEKHTDLELGR